MKSCSKTFLFAKLMVLSPVFIKKLFLLIMVGLFFTACSITTKLKDNSTNESFLIYQSTANGVADILLNLKNNNTFSLNMRIFSQPMSNEQVTIIKTSGKWSKTGNWTRLIFKKKKLDLGALFDKKYAEANQFKIIDERTVDINNKLSELTIWGVVCVKIQK